MKAAPLFVLLLAASPSFALESALAVDPETTSVGTPDRLDETLEQVANSVTVIGTAEIALRNQPFLADLLRTVPGVDVVQAGGPGGVVTVFLRGSDSGHTLVMLDGTPINDAASTSRFYDFAHMTTDNVERIEVLRGPQSVMYGSDAVGGAINIVTKKGSGRLKGSVSGEWGAYETSLYKGELSGSSRFTDYSLAGSRLATGGIPAAGSDYGNTVRDPYREATLAGSLGLKPSQNARVDLTARNSYSSYHLADAGGPGGDDPSYVGSFNQTDLSAKGMLSALDGRLVQTLSLGSSAVNRRFNDADLSSVYPQSFQFDNSTYGQTTKAAYQFVARLAPWNTLTAGVESREERTHQSYASGSPYPAYSAVIDNRTSYAKSVFAEELFKAGGRFFVSVGARRDDDDRFGTANTYRVSPTFLIAETGTKLKASLGTGFKAPSLFQLFSQYGDTGLKPEKSRAWDAGVEQDLWERKASLGATYFRGDVSDLIQYNNATNLYYNVGRARTSGAELTAQVLPSPLLTARANLTYTWARDLDDGTQLLRRPAVKYGGDVEVHPSPRASALIGATYTGPRQDTDFAAFPAKPVKLGGYALWRASGSYAVTERLTLTARVDNLFDKRYEQVEGYGALGIAGYGGVTLSF